MRGVAVRRQYGFTKDDEAPPGGSRRTFGSGEELRDRCPGSWPWPARRPGSFERGRRSSMAQARRGSCRLLPCQGGQPVRIRANAGVDLCPIPNAGRSGSAGRGGRTRGSGEYRSRRTLVWRLGCHAGRGRSRSTCEQTRPTRAEPVQHPARQWAQRGVCRGYAPARHRQAARGQRRVGCRGRAVC